MQKKRNKRVLLVALGVLAILLAVGLTAMGQVVKRAKGLPVSSPSLSTVADGLYLGEYVIEPVQVKVLVEVAGGKLQSVEILSHVNGLGKAAEALAKTMVEKQSLEVDAVAGATVSSKCIVKAVEAALSKGRV